MTPGVVVVLFMIVAQIFDSEALLPLLLAILVVGNMLAHIYLTTPAMRTLIRRRYWPARA
jgi:hypothetical protein